MAPPPKSTSNTGNTQTRRSGGDPRRRVEDRDGLLEMPVTISERAPQARYAMLSVIASGDGGGEDAFKTSEAIREHCPRLLRRALWGTGNSPESEDLVQEAFIRRENHLRNGGNIRDETAFLNAIMRNLIIDFQRRKIRWTSRFVDREIGEYDGFVAFNSDTDPHEELWEAISTLPPLQQEVLYKRFMEGYTQNEIAEQLETSPATISRIKDMALSRLRQQLRES
jgi:RNA polymerase sigma-70 factor (ECF subfamily)